MRSNTWFPRFVAKTMDYARAFRPSTKRIAGSGYKIDKLNYFSRSGFPLSPVIWLADERSGFSLHGPLNRTANGFPYRLPYMVCFLPFMATLFQISRVQNWIACTNKFKKNVFNKKLKWQSRIAWSFIVLSEKINLLFTGSVGPVNNIYIFNTLRLGAAHLVANAAPRRQSAHIRLKFVE